MIETKTFCFFVVQTLNNLIDVLALEEEEANVAVVVGLFDKDKKTRQDRAKILYRKFRSSIDSGIISIVGPSSNIYPANNFYLMTRRPFNNTIERMEWQAKLSLDFAFLFSFSSSLVHTYIPKKFYTVNNSVLFCRVIIS